MKDLLFLVFHQLNNNNNNNNLENWLKNNVYPPSSGIQRRSLVIQCISNFRLNIPCPICLCHSFK